MEVLAEVAVMGEAGKSSAGSEPERIGPYALIQRIGAGGFCEVYLARHHGPQGFVKDVCLKRVLPEHLGDPEYLKPLRDEAVLQAALNHPNIVKVYDFRVIDGQTIVVMDFVDGINLAQLLRSCRLWRERLPSSVALYIVHKMLRALRAAHGLVRQGERQHLIHRDINPKNILLDRAGNPYLIDFGLVKATHRDYRTKSGFVRGTLPYTAPETIMAGMPEHTAREDGRTDLYALGVVLYELLAGQHPFLREGLHDSQILTLIVKGEHPPLAPLAPGLPEGLAALVESMMHRDMDARPESALEACTSLAPYLPNDFGAELWLAQSVTRALGDKPSLATGYAPPESELMPSHVDGPRAGDARGSRALASAEANEETASSEPRPRGELIGAGAESGPGGTVRMSRLVKRGDVGPPRADDKGSVPAAAPSVTRTFAGARRASGWVPGKAVALALLVGAVLGAVVLALWDPAPGKVAAPEAGRVPVKVGPSTALGKPPPLPTSASAAQQPGIQAGGVQGERAAAAAEETHQPAAPATEAVPSPLQESPPPARHPKASGQLAAPGGQAAAQRDDPSAAHPIRATPLPAQEPSSPARRLTTQASAQMNARGKETRSDEKNAWLDIQVRPADRRWQVWVDGQYCGTADVKVKVAAGRRLVEVGAERPTIKRPVRVGSGRTRRVLVQF